MAIDSAERLDSLAALGLPAEAAEPLARAGFNLAGVLAGVDYDAQVPPGWRTERLLFGARSVVVLATGGPEFGRAIDAEPGGPHPRHPVDDFTRRVTGRAAQTLTDSGWQSRALHYADQFDATGSAGSAGVYADFISLARAAGIGVPSRLRLLLHPAFGPWLAIRSLLLTELRLRPSKPLESFDPCNGCAQCARGCPASAFRAGRLDVAACSKGRLRDEQCQQGCPARRACVIGGEHAYGPRWEAHFAQTSLRYVRASYAPDAPDEGQPQS